MPTERTQRSASLSSSSLLSFPQITSIFPAMPSHQSAREKTEWRPALLHVQPVLVYTPSRDFVKLLSKTACSKDVYVVTSAAVLCFPLVLLSPLNWNSPQTLRIRHFRNSGLTERAAGISASLNYCWEAEVVAMQRDESRFSLLVYPHGSRGWREVIGFNRETS